MGTYNGCKYVKDQLQSLAIQTLPPLELIVTDDGSSDATLEIVRSFAERVSFPVVVTINNSNLGFTNNFMSGVSGARGQFVAFCDQDDIWVPQKIERCQEVLTSDPEAALVIHSGQIIDRDGTPQNRRYPDIRADTVSERLARSSPNEGVPGFALVFRRTVFDSLWSAWPHEQYRAAYARYGNLLGHDILLYGAARSFGRIHRIAEPLVFYRVHGGNATARVEALIPGESSMSVALKQALTPSALTYEQMSERWGVEVDILSAALSTDPRLEGLSLLRSYLDNQSRMFGLRAALYAEPSGIRRARLFGRMVATGAYRSRKRGYLGARSAVKDGAFAAGVLPNGRSEKRPR